jgi:hypothetical protein
MPFEAFVRPYQSPGALGRIRIAATPGATRERSTLTWGATSDAKITPARTGTNVECCKRTTAQLDHKDPNDFSNVGVQAPIDSPSAGQRVDFQRADILKFKQHDTNSCAADWEQMSGVAFGTTQALAEFEGDMEFAGDDSTSSDCGGEWHLNNTIDGKP